MPGIPAAAVIVWATVNYGEVQFNSVSGNTVPADEPVCLDVAAGGWSVLPPDVVEGAVPVEQVPRILAYLHGGKNGCRSIYIQGDTIGLGPWLGWLWVWLLHCQPDSGWADEIWAEWAWQWARWVEYMYRVTIQIVSNLPLTSKQMFYFSMRPMY